MNTKSQWLKRGLAAAGLVAALGAVGVTAAPAQARVFVTVGVPLVAPYAPAYVAPPAAYYPPPPVAYAPPVVYAAPVVYPPVAYGYGAPYFGARFGFGPRWR